MERIYKNKTGLALVFVLSCLNLYGANVPNIPNISDAIKQVKPPEIKKKKQLLPPMILEDDKTEKELKDGKKVKVEKFLILDAKNMSNAELKEIVKPYENSMLSFKEMVEITNLITKAYKDKGYFVARAYIPVQDLKKQDNLLKIAVVEGEYGKFILNNDSLVKDNIVQETLDKVKEDKTISTKSLQRALLIINDTPGVLVSGTKIKPGTEVGTSDFEIETKASQKYTGYVVADNYGSQYTGKHRLMAGVDINSPFEIGDKISAFGISSQEAGLLNGRLAYSAPLNEDGLVGEISYLKTTYELGDEYASLDALGYSDSIVAMLTYPVIRSVNENLNSYFSISYNKMKDEILVSSVESKKDTVVASVGVDYNIINQYGNSMIDVYIRSGKLDIKSEEDRQLDEAGANTNGSFTKINLDLKNSFFITENLMWENKLLLQYAFNDKNLDGSEDMSIGGINGVKVFPDGEESGENGYIFGTHLTYQLPNYEGIDSKLGVFYDAGRIHMSENVSNEETRKLQDVGISYSVSYKDFFLDSYLAYKLGSTEITSEDDYNSRFMLQLGLLF